MTDDDMELVGIMVGIDIGLAQEALVELHQNHEEEHDGYTWEDCLWAACQLGRRIQEMLYDADAWAGEEQCQ